MDAMLSTSEVAELTGISLRHVKRLAASNKLPCEKTVNSNNRPKYLFPLSGLAALDPTLPQRYLAQHAQEGTAEGAAEPQNAKRGRGRPRKGGENGGKQAAGGIQHRGTRGDRVLDPGRAGLARLPCRVP